MRTQVERKEERVSMREKLRVQERREAECAKSLSEMHEGHLPLATSAMGNVSFPEVISHTVGLFYRDNTSKLPTGSFLGTLGNNSFSTILQRELDYLSNKT